MKDEILEIVEKAFEGHSVVLTKAINNSGVMLRKMMVSGQSFTLEDFGRLRMLLDDYSVSFLIESNVLCVVVTKEIENG